MRIGIFFQFPGVAFLLALIERRGLFLFRPVLAHQVGGLLPHLNGAGQLPQTGIDLRGNTRPGHEEHQDGNQRQSDIAKKFG